MSDSGLNPGQQALLDTVRAAIMTELGWEDDRGRSFEPEPGLYPGVIWETAGEVAEAAIVAVVDSLRAEADRLRAATLGPSATCTLREGKAALMKAEALRRTAHFLDTGGQP